MFNGVPPPVRALGSAAAIFLGGFFAVSLVSSVTVRTLQSVAEAKRVCYFMLILTIVFHTMRIIRMCHSCIL